ncbi:MAG: hypothetical protein JKY30_06605 [Flavobacteriales bacterium]|nr:hypothetical protein [Flavobacteriales bacterium]
MKRRDFIVKTGTVMTATIFLTSFGGSKLFASSLSDMEYADKKDKDKRPDPSDFEQPILKAIALGVNAPSPHNTQSWKFKILHDNEMLFYVDENILLPATDPPSRQIHIGTGCFIETLVIGSTTFGYDTEIEYFPEGYDSSSDFGKKPVAKISLTKREILEHPLAKQIYKRQTNRRKYKGNVIPHTEFKSIEKTVGSSHSKMIFINDVEEMKPYLDIFYKGFEIESKTFRTNEETRHLFRYSEKERVEKRDGISIPQMGYKGIMKWLAENSLDNGSKEKWHSEKSINLSLKSVLSGIESTKGIIFWKTEQNNFIDWIKMGRDYVKFELSRTSLNLYVHPYNQAIQEYDEMKTVRNELNSLMNIKNEEKIQMIVRIGRSSTPYYSYRRNVEKYLTE